MKKLIFLALYLFFCSLYSPILAQNSNANLEIAPIQLNPYQEGRFINDSIRVFHALDTLTGEEAWKKIRAGVMTESLNKQKANVNLADDGFWLVFSLRNYNIDQAEYYLELAYNRTDLIHFYEIKDDSVQLAYTTGDTFNFSQRPVVHRNFVFPIQFAQNEEKLFLVNLEKRNTVDRFPLKIYPVDKFYSYKDNENIIYGLFFGIIALILVVSIWLSVYTKMSVFGYYGLYATSIGLFLATSLGLTFQILTPNMPKLNYINLGLLIPVSMVLMIKFCQAYFSTDKYFPIANKAYNIFLGNFILLLVIWVVAPDIYKVYAVNMLYYTYFGIFSVFAISFITAYYYRKINRTNAIFFGLGYGASFIGIGYAILIDTGTIYSTLFTDSSLSILSGFFMELLFLSSAMIVFVHRHMQLPDLGKTFERVNANDEYYIKLNDKQKVNVSEICFVQAYGHYLKFHFAEDVDIILERKTLKSILEELPEQQFGQVHRSTVVNIKKINKMNSRQVVLKSGKALTVTRTYYPKAKNLYKQQGQA